MKTVHLYEITGQTLNQNQYLGNQSFHSVPRIGEKIIVAFNDDNFVFDVVEVMHSFIPNVADEVLYLRRLSSYDDFMSS